MFGHLDTSKVVSGGCMAELFIYYRGKSFHVRDVHGGHWTLQQHRGGTYKASDGSPIDPQAEILHTYDTLSTRDLRKKKNGGGTYGRFQSPGASWLPSIRGSAHGAANVLLQQGSWAWYTGLGGAKRPPSRAVAHTYIPKRTHTEVMRAATLTEVGEEKSATDYARLRSRFLSVTSAHANIRYEWCHLVGHGMGGADTEINIVAGTAYQNTEQLILECVLHSYRMEGLEVEVQAKLAPGWDHLAESIWYQVKLGDHTIYSRTMDARRATRPDFKEYGAVAREMRKSINVGLENYYAAKEMTMEQYNFILSEFEHLPSEPDESAGLWTGLSRHVLGTS